MANETMFDIPVASMKIGVGVPIQNHHFKYWDDPGTWVVPSKWLDVNSSFSIWRKEDTAGAWLGYEDDSSAKFNIASAADDWAQIVHSNAGNGVLFWPSTLFDLDTAQKYYWAVAISYAVGTPGGNGQVGLFFDVGSSASMAAINTVEFKAWTSGSADITLFKGTMETATAIVTTAGYDYARIRAAIRDCASNSHFTPSFFAVMFNPFDGTGYYELENVFPANGPMFSYDRFTRLVRTNTHVGFRYDPSGGAERVRLEMEFRNEDTSFYEMMLKFYRLNHGQPGVPGVPLSLEPNLPGLPPVILGHFMNQSFPLRRDAARANRYSGSFTFEGVW